jgi:histidinol-phosphatase
MTPRDWLAFLEELAGRADRIALDFFRSSTLEVDAKADSSPVSEADKRIEAMVRSESAARHPGLGVFGEEEGEEVGDSGARLIVDPIDATRNFIRGIPIFATLLAIESDGEIVAGVVSAPALGSRWRASLGNGAFLGKDRIHVSTVERLRDAQLFHGDVVGSSEALPPERLSRFVGRVERGRGFGDFFQHVLVAQGCGEVAVDPVVSPWDAAPIPLILEEAGGRATSLEGDRTIYAGSLVTSNGILHEETLRRLDSNS